MLFIKSKSFLTRFKEEAFTHFEKEIAHASDDGIFQLGFGVGFIGFEPQKLQRDGVFDDISRFGDILPFIGEPQHFILPPTEDQTLIQTGIDLSLQLPHTPVLLGAFYLVEIACCGILHADENEIVAPGECKQSSLFGL